MKTYKSNSKEVSEKVQDMVKREFINTLHINNNSNREFSDEDVYKMYKLLVSRAIDKLIK